MTYDGGSNMTNTTNFSIRMEQPNKETVLAMLEAESVAHDSSVKHYSDVGEALKELKK